MSYLTYREQLLKHQRTKSNRDTYKRYLLEKIDKEREVLKVSAKTLKKELKPSQISYTFLSQKLKAFSHKSLLDKAPHFLKNYPYLSFYLGKKVITLVLFNSFKSRKALLRVGLLTGLGWYFFRYQKENNFKDG